MSNQNTPILKQSQNPNLIQNTRTPYANSYVNLKQNGSKSSLLSMNSVNTSNSIKNLNPHQGNDCIANQSMNPKQESECIPRVKISEYIQPIM